ncbi:MAG: transposase, partial [Synergistaceae bacterium]|nr:transposase [Synergistaceae bacterium]
MIAEKLKNLCRRRGIKLLLLPAYSPDYNPIEKSWANMKRALRALIDTIPACEDVPMENTLPRFYSMTEYENRIFS